MKKVIYAMLLLAAAWPVQARAQEDQTVTAGPEMFVFRRLVRETPQEKEKILASARKVVGQPGLGARMALFYHLQVAGALLDAGLYLEDAERFARQGVALCDREKFIAASFEIFKTNGRPLPTEEFVANEFKTTKARLLSILGRIEWKRGELPAAEQTLKEAYALNPMEVATAVALSDIAERKRDSTAAFDYLVPAMLSASVPKDVNERLMRLYKKMNGGQDAGLEELLDKKYHDAFPFQVEAYQPPATRSNRMVLAELFSGSGCSPCVIVDLAYEGLLQRYRREDVAVLVYHLHRPLPDPMANPLTELRAGYYKVRGAPSVAFDGNFIGDSIGGAAWDRAVVRYREFTAQIDRALTAPAGAELKLSATTEGSMVKVKVLVDKVQTASEDLRLHIVLAEDLLRYTGENGIRFHPMVVRSMSAPDGTPVAANRPTTLEHAFDVAKIAADLKSYLDEFEKNPPGEYKGEEVKFRRKMDAIDPKNLSVVAFVQDHKTKQVLQTAYIKVK